MKLSGALAYEGTHSLEIDDDMSGQSYVRVILPPYLLNSSEVKVVFMFYGVSGDVNEQPLIRLGWYNPVAGDRGIEACFYFNLTGKYFYLKIDPVDWYEPPKETTAEITVPSGWANFTIIANKTGTYLISPGTASLSVPFQDFNLIEIGADPSQAVSYVSRFLIDDIRIYVRPRAAPLMTPAELADKLISLLMSSIFPRQRPDSPYCYDRMRWNATSGKWYVWLTEHLLPALIGAYMLTENKTYLQLAEEESVWKIPLGSIDCFDVPALVALAAITGSDEIRSWAKEGLNTLWDERWNSTYERFITNPPEEVWCLESMRWAYAYLSYYLVFRDELYLRRAERIFLGYWNLRNKTTNIPPAFAYVSGTAKPGRDWANQYHMGTLLCVAIDIYRASGNTTFLKMAKAIADSLIRYYWTEHGSWRYRCYTNGSPRSERFEMLWGIQEYGLCALYELTGNKTYLDYVSESFRTRVLLGVGTYNGLIQHGASYSGAPKPSQAVPWPWLFVPRVAYYLWCLTGNETYMEVPIKLANKLIDAFYWSNGTLSLFVHKIDSRRYVPEHRRGLSTAEESATAILGIAESLLWLAYYEWPDTGLKVPVLHKAFDQMVEAYNWFVPVLPYARVLNARYYDRNKTLIMTVFISSSVCPVTIKVHTGKLGRPSRVIAKNIKMARPARIIWHYTKRTLFIKMCDHFLVQIITWEMCKKTRDMLFRLQYYSANSGACSANAIPEAFRLGKLKGRYQRLGEAITRPPRARLAASCASSCA